MELQNARKWRKAFKTRRGVAAMLMRQGACGGAHDRTGSRQVGTTPPSGRARQESGGRGWRRRARSGHVYWTIGHWQETVATPACNHPARAGRPGAENFAALQTGPIQSSPAGRGGFLSVRAPRQRSVYWGRWSQASCFLCNVSVLWACFYFGFKRSSFDWVQ